VTCFGYFLVIFRPNKEPGFRYIKCAPNAAHFIHVMVPLGAHFMYLNSGSLLGLKMAKK